MKVALLFDRMEEKLFNKIIAETYTLTQLQRRLETLRLYLNIRLFKKNTDTSLPIPEDDLNWLISLGDDFYKEINVKNHLEVFTKLESLSKSQVPITIVIPFDIPGGEIIHLVSNLRSDLNRLILVEIKHDPELIAGCALVYKGVYRDYSIRAKIEQNKEKILEGLKNYAK